MVVKLFYFRETVKFKLMDIFIYPIIIIQIPQNMRHIILFLKILMNI